MKKLLAIIALTSMASVSFAWDRMGSDVVFDTRSMGVSDRATQEPMQQDEGMVRYQPIFTERSRPIYHPEYRPVRGVVRGAETAAEGVVEGAAQAVDSLIP